MTQADKLKYRFSGHQTFVFRYGWLEKGVRGVLESPTVFGDDDAMVRLGVGKNMVESIRYCCLVTQLLDSNSDVGRRKDRHLRVTEIVAALGLQDHWRAVEAFVEEGSWPLPEVEGTLAGLASRSGRFKGRLLWAVDDLKVLKSGKRLWGACSFHEYTSRSSNRPETVWAHNWLICGALKVGPNKAFLPTSARLYLRREQMPQAESFRTKTELAVEVLRGCARAIEGPHLAVFDGAYALSTTVQPLINAPDGERRIEFLTRLRFDSRLYEPPPVRRAGQRGRPRRWGERLPAPGDADRWPGQWRRAKALVYGQERAMRYKKALC